MNQQSTARRATARSLPTDATVTWRDGYRPANATWDRATVFISDSRQTTVMVDGNARPLFVATVALEVVR